VTISSTGLSSYSSNALIENHKNPSLFRRDNSANVGFVTVI